jgi:hypothetical protein
MSFHSETPPRTGSIVRNGAVFEKVWTPSEYRNPSLSATEIAASIIASKFHLPLSTARVICELADIGGRCE